MEIDESKYDNEFSRLLAALGKEALKKLQASKILLCGLGGLGIEIAKNIILMGVASLTIHDPRPTSISDLSSQFYLSEECVGKNRAESCVAKLRELNERVKINIYNDEINENNLANFTVVVLTDIHSKSEMLKINEFCHANNIAFISGGVWGLFGWVFDDFGDEHIILDPNGELPKDSFIENITNSQEGVISVVDTKRHDLEDGDVVKFEEIQGMTELNGTTSKVTVTGPFTFTIGDTSSFNRYIKGGHIVEVKVPKKIKFKPLSEYLGKLACFDDILLVDENKLERTMYYQYYIEAILDFHEEV